MHESTIAALAAWSEFYTMLGSAAAALTGLMFVVIGLVMGWTHRRRSHDGVSVFSTPTVVHFGASLLVAAILLVPWHSVTTPAVLVGLTGLAGVAYMLRLIYRTRNLASYRADLDDWAWYNILPFVAYGTLAAGGFWSVAAIDRALFVVAAASLLLTFIGIRNAWDIVTFIAISED